MRRYIECLSLEIFTERSFVSVVGVMLILRSTSITLKFRLGKKGLAFKYWRL